MTPCDDGHMPNQPKTQARTVRVDDETWDAVQREAEKSGTTASHIVRLALHALLSATKGAALVLVLAVGIQGAIDADAAAARPEAKIHANTQDAVAFDALIAGQVAEQTKGRECWEPGAHKGVIPATVLVRGMRAGQGMGVVRALSLDEGWTQAKAKRVWILKACA